MAVVGKELGNEDLGSQHCQRERVLAPAYPLEGVGHLPADT